MKYAMTIFLLLATTAFIPQAQAQTVDGIAVTEVRRDIGKWVLWHVTLDKANMEGRIVYAKYDDQGNPTGELHEVVFQNLEGDAQLNQFVSYIETRIRAGDSLNLAINKAAKIKEGI